MSIQDLKNDNIIDNNESFASLMEKLDKQIKEVYESNVNGDDIQELRKEHTLKAFKELLIGCSPRTAGEFGERHFYRIKVWFSKNTKVAEELTDFALGNFYAILINQNKNYTIAPQKLIRCFRLSDLEKLVLLELLTYSGNGVAFPSHQTLAFNLGKKSVTSIKNALKSLEDKQFITWTSGNCKLTTNQYYIKELYKNGYIIVSEMIHFFRDTLIKKCNNQLPMDKIVDIINNEIIDIPKSKWLTMYDFYGIFVEFIMLNPHLFSSWRSCNFVGDFFNYLSDYVSVALDISIDVDWDIITRDIILEKMDEVYPEMKIKEMNLEHTDDDITEE